MKKITLLFLSALISISVYTQDRKDKSYFKEYIEGTGYYYESILKDVREQKEKKGVKKDQKLFKMDVSGMDLPNKIDLYKSEWHNPPISQGNAGTCWCFSTTSLFETEIYRLTKQQVKLSEIYTVYWEYVEKAIYFVQQRGNSVFEEGSEANATPRLYKKYGIVPAEIYTGLKEGQKFHSHEDMYNEMNTYLLSVKKNNSWNEAEVIATIKSILNHYLGEPPTEFNWNGKKYTPKQYLQDVLKLNPDDYVDILSYMQQPYWQQVEYEVVDNWWHSKDYYNVPLDIFIEALKNAVRSGYTVAIGGDVSEPGFQRETQCGMVPTFDIPSSYIDEHARQFRFSNQTTTDDHGMHIVGYVEKDGKTWFLVKDSSAGSRNNDEKAKEFGYYFFHEDYVKLKMMDFAVHKDAVKDILKMFK